MKRRRVAGIFLATALCVAGCGSSGRGQQAAVQKTETVQEVKAQGGNADKMQEAQDAQTEWEAKPIQNADEKAPSRPEEVDGSKYQADFLGIDSSKIKSCMIYHDLGKEELDMSTAKGKYFIQMLSGFFDSPKYQYMDLSDIYEMWQIESMERWVTKSYYIRLQIEDAPNIVINESGGGDISTKTIRGYDTLLVGVNPEFGDFILRWNLGIGSEEMSSAECWGMMEGTAEFEEKYEAWKNIEDWDAAFAEAERERASRQGGGIVGKDGVKGIEASQMQLCRVYHNGSQEDIDLMGDRGAAFIQMLSGFLEEQTYSQGFPYSDVDDMGIRAEIPQ